jgi:sporulation protein YlmC with PRC-barrel domain
MRAKDLIGFRIHATDGDIGHVRDLYFDDEQWRVRQVVVDTGHWLPGRQVLVSPRLLVSADPRRHRLGAALTQQQVRTSPSIASEKPISRHHEIDPDAYLNMLFFWTDGDFLRSIPGTTADHDDDRHLYSVRGVTNYTVHASDGDVGHVGDLMVDGDSWAIESIVVDVRRWLPGQHVLIPTASVAWISELEMSVHVRASAEAVRAGVRNDAGQHSSEGAAA